MVSESDLVERLREFLRSSDLNTTTTAIVRRRLEEDFGVDLSDRKAFIREQVDLFLQSQLENVKGEEDEEENGSDVGEAGNGGEDEESEEEEGSDEEEEATASNGKDRRKRPSNKLSKDNKRKAGGFTKICSLSPQLQNFLGVSELARTEVVKQLWAYIREKKLQNPENKRNIICDEALRTLFAVKSIDMFQMNKVLSKHIWPLASDDGPDKPNKPIQKEKQRKQEKGPDASMPKQKRRKGASSGADQKKGGNLGFLAPIPLSDALVKFFGTGESALTRADVVKRMWDYIKQNNLQDPSDKRNVICDERLRELFEVDSFHGFSVSKLLASHFIKTEQ